ncbi:hypothetical protein O5Y58_07975 [Microbacterium paraoxydans]
MRSTRPMPGNPWPHDMTLVTDEVRSDAAAYRAALDSFGRGPSERPSRA